MILCNYWTNSYDNFKNLNDTRGHQAGDEFLIDLAAEIKGSFRETDIVGRIGGEEFVIFISGEKDDDELIEKAEETAQIILKLCHGVRIDSDAEKEFSCSVGIARYPFDGESYSALYEKADSAMYSVKKNGKNNYAFYKESENM